MLARRVFQLFWGLFLYGIAIALMVRADLGLNPWDVFHQGVADLLDWSIGTVIIAVGAAVLLLWIPLRQRPGFGTLSNIVLIGISADIGLALLPELQSLTFRILFLLSGILLLGIAAAAYIGAGLGPGPRDGLMTGLVQRTGWPLFAVRTGLEVSVLAVGFALGGTIGIGTLLFAVAIGPIIHACLPFFTIRDRPKPRVSGECLQDCAS